MTNKLTIKVSAKNKAKLKSLTTGLCAFCKHGVLTVSTTQATIKCSKGLLPSITKMNCKFFGLRKKGK